jgi:hypothetical protein
VMGCLCYHMLTPLAHTPWGALTGYWVQGWGALTGYWVQGWVALTGYWVQGWGALTGYWVQGWVALTGYWVQGWVALLCVHHGEPPVVALTRPVGIVQHLNTQHQQRKEDAHKLLAGTRSTAAKTGRGDGQHVTMLLSVVPVLNIGVSLCVNCSARDPPQTLHPSLAPAHPLPPPCS